MLAVRVVTVAHLGIPAMFGASLFLKVHSLLAGIHFTLEQLFILLVAMG